MSARESFIKTESFELATYAAGGFAAGRLALVLPGLLDTKDYPHMKSHVELLADRGFLALSFDPPGTWQSQGDISLYTTSNYLKAVEELIAHFGNRPTFVMGHSMGGSMSMYAAARSATVMGFAAIMSAPSFVREDNYDLRVTKWRLDGVKLSYRDLPDDPDHTRQFSLPYSFSEDSRQYSAQEDLKTLSKPKLFIAGEHDASVPKAVVEATYGIAAEPKKLEVLDSDHDYRKHPELIEKVNRILDAFLRQLV